MQIVYIQGGYNLYLWKIDKSTKKTKIKIRELKFMSLKNFIRRAQSGQF